MKLATQSFSSFSFFLGGMREAFSANRDIKTEANEHPCIIAALALRASLSIFFNKKMFTLFLRVDDQCNFKLPADTTEHV